MKSGTSLYSEKREGKSNIPPAEPADGMCIGMVYG
ncbi:hypothetical protein SJDPG2_09880 [Porphyromonas gingivalis SJD2]|nr:hypothetical protein SJDPG2_09880 [Porphyromonas gingivalis SJD2]OWR75593.1 hypothetical protein SJDPG5_08905 [Porphyromonas gingivalis SJD5]